MVFLLNISPRTVTLNPFLLFFLLIFTGYGLFDVILLIVLATTNWKFYAKEARDRLQEKALAEDEDEDNCNNDEDGEMTHFLGKKPDLVIIGGDVVAFTASEVSSLKGIEYKTIV